jgi:hypothetical protein
MSNRIRLRRTGFAEGCLDKLDMTICDWWRVATPERDRYLRNVNDVE